MLTTVLDQVGKVRENRLLLVAFAPTLVLLVASATVVTHATDSGDELLGWWDARPGTVQALLVLALAAALYVVASVVLANTTRLIQLVEGLPWKDSFVGKAGIAAHKRRRSQRPGRAYPRYLPDSNQPVDDPLPTGVGNALQTGERHALLAYGIRPIALWSRLVPQLPEAEQTKLDEARTGLDFLVVVCGYAVLFTVGAMTFLAIHGAEPTLYLLAVGSGIAVAFLAYIGAEQAALTLAALIATAFDTHRYKVLQELRLPLPVSPAEEQRLWAGVDQLIRAHSPPAIWIYQPPSSE